MKREKKLENKCEEGNSKIFLNPVSCGRIMMSYWLIVILPTKQQHDSC
jgi:hypothetical protein